MGSLLIVLLQIFSWFWQWNNFENQLIFNEVKAYCANFCATLYRQSGKDSKTTRVPYSFTKLHELSPTNCLKWDRHFYSRSVNSAFYFIARLRTRRSANRTQPNCDILGSEPTCKCMLKIWEVRPKSWEAKSAYFAKVLISTKLCQMKKPGKEVLPGFRKRSPWLQCQRNKVAPHSECKWNHRN